MCFKCNCMIPTMTVFNWICTKIFVFKEKYCKTPNFRYPVNSSHLVSVNLALHGTVAQETTYTDGAGISYTANLAIEGPANNNWEDGCSATAANQKTAWWGLRFPKLVYITNVKRYSRKDSKSWIYKLFLVPNHDTSPFPPILCVYLNSTADHILIPLLGKQYELL